MGAAEKMVLWDSWLRGGVAESDWANVLASRHRYLLPTNPGCCVDRLSWQPCVDVYGLYGPRPIATGRRDQVQWSQLLTYIRLLMRHDISSPRAPMDFRALPP